jgi:medium-chain acyl-[acyl-carrier-protein] hydrolase
MSAIPRPPKSLLVTRKKPHARYRLFCFPYSGGSAAVFQPWEELLPDDIELVAIRLPGHSGRMNEVPLTSVAEMADSLMPTITAWLDRPYLIYGHSLGAIVAFELLHALQAKRLPLPHHFFCAGRRAPHAPPRIEPIHDWPLERFVSELRRLNGTPEILLTNPSWIDLFIPILRTDLKAAYIYHREPDVKLECSASAFCGSRDLIVLHQDMAGWREHFSEPPVFRTFEGGHFFLDDSQASLVEAICDRVVRRAAEA